MKLSFSWFQFERQIQNAKNKQQRIIVIADKVARLHLLDCKQSMKGSC